MLIALAWFINAQRHLSPETKMATVGALLHQKIFCQQLLSIYLVYYRNTVQKKNNAIAVLKLSRPKSYSLWTHPCCHQGAHCECFRYWAPSSPVDGTVRCSYCRTLFRDN